MSREVVEYHVVETMYWTELKNAVNELIKKGWQPQGGIAVMFRDSGSSTGYVQAMVRYEDSK